MQSLDLHFTLSSSGKMTIFRGLGPLPPMNPLALCMHACIKKGRLKNKTFFELKNEGYRDGIKRKETR